MPRPEAIEQFRRALSSLTAATTGVATGPGTPEPSEPGEEPSALEAAAAEEASAESPAPEEEAPTEGAAAEIGELPPDLGELLGELDAGAPAPAETSEEAPFDLGELLGEDASLAERDAGEPAVEAAAPGAEETAAEWPTPEEPIPEEPVPEASSEKPFPGEPALSQEGLPDLGFEEPLPTPQGQEAGGLETGSPEAPTSAEEALLNAFAGEAAEELPPLGSDLDSLAVLPEEAEGAFAGEAGAPGESVSADAGSLSIPDEFLEPAAGPGEATEPGGVPAAPGGEEHPGGEAAGEPEGFELGDLGELSFEQPRGQAAPPAAPAPGPRPAAEPAGGAPTDDVSLPDIGGLDELTLPAGLQPGAPEEPGPAAGVPPRREARGRARARPEPRGRPAGRAGGGLAEGVPAAEAADREGLTGEQGEIQLTDEEFDRLRRTLASLPRNLKISVQDLIAEGQGSAPDVRRLIRMLVDGAAPQAIADLAGRITGKRIRLPAAFEKRTGLAFEEEQRSFGFAFRQNILPLARLFALAVIGAGLVGFLGYQFVYQPLHANSTYRHGYDLVQAERYTDANQSFQAATRIRPLKAWFYRYAEAFTGKRQYDLAAQKYQELLGRWPGERRAVLDWARMESTLRAAYEEANRILQERLLAAHPWDYDGLLAAGDNYLEWASENAAHYEDARLAWTKLMERYGQPQAVLVRMLRYFVRTDDLAEAERLRAYFFGRRRPRLDTTGAESFAELGGYLVGKRQLDYARDVLDASAAADRSLPDPHYQLARFYRAMGQAPQEQRALEAARDLLAAKAKLPQPMTLPQVLMQIDTQTRLGEVLYDQERSINAEQAFRQATGLVRGYEASGVLRAGSRQSPQVVGRPFARLADVSYFVAGDLARARADYLEAVARGFTGPEIDYKLGYISYASRDWATAQGLFLRAEDGLAAAEFDPPDELGVSSLQSGQAPPALLFALGNAFYERGDWSAAEGSWRRLLQQLTDRRQAIRNFQPLERSEHRALLEGLVKTNTNLGVALARLAVRSGDRTLESTALANLATAAEGADTLGRNPQTLAAGEAISLASLDMRGILYPVSGFELQIFRAIPKDLLATSF